MSLRTKFILAVILLLVVLVALIFFVIEKTGSERHFSGAT